MAKNTAQPSAAASGSAQVPGLVPDADALRARVDAVLGEPLYWFPVRHHSPAVARHLQTSILERKPKLVFIEGPSDANDLIQHVVDGSTKPPVAIYSSYRDDDNVLGLAGIESPGVDIPPRFSCWYPLLAYSPEYVAMVAARKVGARVVFIDLPHYAQLEPARKPPEGAGEPLEAPPHADRPASGHAVERKDELLFVESGFYQQLARAAGYRSWDEAWDSMFELRMDADVETFRRELATFCAAVRATTVPDRILADGTLPRERFMLQTIRTTLAQTKTPPEQALVVCGGFHLFLDRDDAEPPPTPPAGTVYTTVVPYSFFRVSELSGYAAGNRAPQFYQTVWDLAAAGRADELLVQHTVSTLKQARRNGEGASSADAIAVSQHAEMLARLRGRPRPVLDDMHDAVWTCCCKGDPNDVGTHLRQAIDAADIGTKIGKVTAALGRLPIVSDFYTQLADLDLGEILGKERRMVLDLDKRDDLAGRRSAFLHRLRFLAIGVGDMAEAPSGDLATGKIFREKWALRWSPQIEPALIEQTLYGDSVEAAVLARLKEELAREEGNAEATCRRLAQALDMDLPNLIHQVEEACGRAIDADGRFISQSQALGYLTVIDRYAVFRNLRRDLLADLILRCFDRACFALPEVASAPEEQHKAIVTALLGLAEVVLRGDRPELDRALFVQHVRQAAADTTVPFLRGVFLGMLAETRNLTAAELAAEVSALSRAPLETMVTAGDFLDGVLAVSRTSIMLGADVLIGAIDELLKAAPWESFLVMLPRLRAAMERLHERDRDSLAARVAERYGLKESAQLTTLHTSVGAAARLAEIDRRVAAIMEPWDI